jgi:DNA-directed RNA polymerase specialized sigma24 family protein
LLAAVRGLPARDRTIIALRYGAELDYVSIGSALDMSAAAAGVAGRRAIGRLRKHLTRDSEEPAP